MRILRALTVFLILMAAISKAQSTDSTTQPGVSFIQPDDIDVKTLLKPPPAEGSDQSRQELDVLLGLQNSRTDADIKRARAEAHLTPFVFSEVLGSWFNPDDLPVTAAFLANVMKETGSVATVGKDLFQRRRPYLVDTRIQPCVELEKTFSYPSGHSTRSMVLALTLAEIFPDQKDALIARAKLIGYDRELAGEHFPSDVAAGQTLAKAIFEKMDANPDFKADIEKVQEECLAHEKKN